MIRLLPIPTGHECQRFTTYRLVLLLVLLPYLLSLLIGSTREYLNEWFLVSPPPLHGLLYPLDVVVSVVALTSFTRSLSGRLEKGITS